MPSSLGDQMKWLWLTTSSASLARKPSKAATLSRVRKNKQHHFISLQILENSFFARYVPVLWWLPQITSGLSFITRCEKCGCSACSSYAMLST